MSRGCRNRPVALHYPRPQREHPLKTALGDRYLAATADTRTLKGMIRTECYSPEKLIRGQNYMHARLRHTHKSVYTHKAAKSRCCRRCLLLPPTHPSCVLRARSLQGRHIIANTPRPINKCKYQTAHGHMPTACTFKPDNQPMIRSSSRPPCVDLPTAVNLPLFLSIYLYSAHTYLYIS